MAVALCCGAVVGCGDEPLSPEQARVRYHLPDARDIRCEKTPGVSRCRAWVRKRPVGREHWDCEFRGTRLSGTESCWTKDGSVESLRDSGAGPELERILEER
jgi:hypothetical protein